MKEKSVSADIQAIKRSHSPFTWQAYYQLHPLLMQIGSQMPLPTRDESQAATQPSSAIFRTLPPLRLSPPPSSLAVLFWNICQTKKLPSCPVPHIHDAATSGMKIVTNLWIYRQWNIAIFECTGLRDSTRG